MKKSSIVLISLLAMVALGTVAYGSAGFTDWDANGFRDRFLPSLSSEASSTSSETSSSEEASSEEEPILLEEYHVRFSINHIFYGTYNDETETYGSISWMEQTFRQEFGIIFDPELINGFGTITYCFPGDIFTGGDVLKIFDDDEINYGEFVLFGHPYGFYDFANILITEPNQILVPTYTPLYA